MSSLKMTFSLTSLILIFALAFVVTPVMAQNSPTVEITEHLGRTTLGDIGTAARTAQARDDFRVLLTFSHPVEALAVDDVQFRLLNLVDGIWSTRANVAAAPTAIDATGATTTTGDLTRFVVSVNGGAVSATSTNTRVEIIVSDGVVDGTTSPYNGPIVGDREEFALPTVLANTEVSFGMPEAVPNQLSQYTVMVTFTNITPTTPAGATTADETLDNAAPITSGTNDLRETFINVMPAGADIVVGGGTHNAVTGDTAGQAGTSTYPLTVTLRSGVDSVTLSINPGYAMAAAEMGSVTVPSALPAPVVTAEPATNAVGDRPNGDIDVSWTWSGMDDQLEKYIVAWGPGGSSADIERADDGTIATMYTIPDAELRASTYDISVTAVATDASNLMDGVGTVEDVAAPTAENPPAPEDVEATADDDANTITVEWTDVAGLDYEVTKSYMMDDGTEATKVFNADSDPAVANPLVIPPTDGDPLPQGVEFTFTVTATDSDDLTSDASDEATAMLLMDVNPTVDISTLSHAGNMITVRFTFAEADMVPDEDGEAEELDEDDYDALAVPTALMGSMIKVTTDAEGMNYANIPAPRDGVRLNNPNVFDVTIDTGGMLPLYVTLEDADMHVSAIGISGGDMTFVPVEEDMNTPSLMLTSGKTQTIDIPSATSSSEQIPLGDYTIGAYDFFVLVRDIDASGIYMPGSSSTWVHSENVALPDLDWFFGTRVVRGSRTNGGTIALHGPTGENAKDLVFSEVMWGTDSSLAVDECSQWIEFYNATPEAIDLSDYYIQFHRSQVPSSAWTGAIDVVSNVNVHSPFFAPSEFPGQSGRSNVADTQDAADRQTQVDLVSMYRSLDEPRIRDFNVANRGERDKGIGGWNASVYPTANISPIHIATPGSHQIVHVTLSATKLEQRIIINEIGNSSNDAYDWFEMYNTTDANVNIENWELTRVYKDGNDGKEVKIARFPKIEIPAKGYVVVSQSHPNNDGNDLAAGIDLTKADADQRNRGLGSKPDSKVAYYLVDNEVKFMNDDGRYLYILRNHHDKLGSAGNVEDVVGTLSIEVRGDLGSGFTGYAAHARQLWDTASWPLQKAGKRHDDVITDGPPENFRPGYVYQRNGKNSGMGEHHLSVRGYTGLGYDRHVAVSDENGGTPGYDNGSVKAKIADVGGTVSISEIMVVTSEKVVDGSRVPRATGLPQWLELYNSSLTQGVNLHNWYFEVLNAPSEELGTRDLHGTLRLPSVVIPPNQTVLIVSRAGLDSGNFPDQRVINLFTNSSARQQFNLTNRDDAVLSDVGFYIELRDPDNKLIDKIGNLNVVERRGGLEPRDPSTFDTAWGFTYSDDHALAGESMLYSPEGYRTSLIRIYDNGTPRDGQMGIGGPKDANTSWVRASDTNFRNVPSLTYYGNHRDYGTPGYRGGGPLPVQLSKFRPERLDDGSVVIRWITESELNNAGFNILRSDTRDGQFTKVNKQLIAGHGTTSERNTYEWKDTSAKPSVVYYYQIQDVSIDGKVQTLKVSRLKGNVSPAGKATTIWGELKALQ